MVILPQPRAQREPIVPSGGIEHHVRDMTATFAADVTLEAAQASLSQHIQWLPIDGDPQATLGQLVETNSTGPLRLGYGAWRDLLLGCQFRNGRGELITAGGRTVKNVAGYDLTKFMVGQHGVFGKIITLTTRTYRRPDAALLAQFEPEVKHFNTLLMTPLRPQWCVLTREALICGYLGDDRAVAFHEANLPAHHPQHLKRHALDDDMALRTKLWACGNFRISLPPSAILRFIDDTDLSDWSADAAFGIIVGRAGPSSFQRLASAAGACGGSALLLDPAGTPFNLVSNPSVHQLLARLKRAFDPDARLALLRQEHS